MSSKDFIQWLKGFTQGVHHYSLSPKQWDELKNELSKVDDNTTIPYVSTPGWVTNTTNDG